jgi:hypothetical protein
MTLIKGESKIQAMDAAFLRSDGERKRDNMIN